MIGSKSLSTLLLLALALLTARGSGLLAPERVASFGFEPLFFVGCFAVVVGTLIYRFWGLKEPSAHYFRATAERTLWDGEAQFLGVGRFRIAVGENAREAFDLPPRAQHSTCILLALTLALACIDARSLGLLGHVSRGVAAASASYCPDAEAERPKETAEVPGCALIRRAYQLGYAKSLGDCDAKVQAGPGGPSGICTLRQRDEPLLHYAFRQMGSFFGKVGTYTRASYFGQLKQEFQARTARLDTLRKSEREILTSAPHAAYHLWTNLPAPPDGLLSEERCADRYRFLPHRPPPGGSAGQVLEHVLAQLLFESRYEPPAGACREFHVHWGAPPDACEQLASAPRAYLEMSGAWGSVHAVLERYRLARELHGAGEGPAPRAEPSQFLSFQCYMEGDRPGRASLPLTLDGVALSAEELRAAPAGTGALFVDRYQSLAELLVRGFHYGALLSEAGLDKGEVAGLEPSFTGSDFLLSRLSGLASLDIYLDPGWLPSRPDLLEVYPYQLHLKNYVQVFRRQYRQERGRL